jgi:hypothetical protein
VHDAGPGLDRHRLVQSTYKTARWHGRTLRRSPGMLDANIYEVETDKCIGFLGRIETDAIRAISRSNPP